MNLQSEYAAMCAKLTPLAAPAMNIKQRESAEACIRAGEPYEALLDLLWAAAESNAPRNILLDALALVDDEDKDQFHPLIKERPHAPRS